jgi:YVTN family beta-propeller protein
LHDVLAHKINKIFSKAIMSSAIIASQLGQIPFLGCANIHSKLNRISVKARSAIAVLIVALANLCAAANAQNVIGTIQVGVAPTSAAVNPITNRIYVANGASNSVTVIDGTTSAAIATLAVGAQPRGIAINTVTNKIYVANTFSSDVHVLDGNSNTLSARIGLIIEGFTGIEAIALNPVTNRVYVVSQGAFGGNGRLAVIDGATNTLITSIVVGARSRALSVNATTNRIYVTNGNSNSVSVIDGVTNAVIATVPTGTFPDVIAINPVTNKVYVASGGSNNFTVIDGVTNVATAIAIATPVEPTTRTAAIVVNAAANKIYAALSSSNRLIAIDGVNNSIQSVPLGSAPSALSLDPQTNSVYVASGVGNTVSFFDGATLSTLAVPATANNPQAIAINTLTKKVYIANTGGNSVSVMEGRFNTEPERLTFGHEPNQLVVNPVSNLIVSPNYEANTITILNASTKVSTTVNIGRQAAKVAVNSLNNRVYVSGIPVLVIDASTGLVVATIPVGVGDIVVNPVTNKIYGAAGVNTAVIDGVTNKVIALPSTGAGANKIVINPVTNKIYVYNQTAFNETAPTISVIDGTTNLVVSTVVLDSGLRNIAVNSVTNKIYGTTFSGNLLVIDGVTDTLVASVPVGVGWQWLSINRITNKIYISKFGTSSPYFLIVDGATLAVQGIPNTGFHNSIYADEIENRVHVAQFNGAYLLTFDGATNVATQLPLPVNPIDAVVNPVDGKIYVSGGGLNGIVLLEPRKSVNTPLRTTVTSTDLVAGLNNAIRTPNPTFSFTPSSSYAPTTPTVRTVYYQLDTKTGPWIQASGTATFSATLSNVPRGQHVLFAFAVDSLEGGATGGNTWSGPGVSPLVGAVAAFPFTVVDPMLSVTIPPESAFTPNAFSFPDQSNLPLNTQITSNAVTISGVDVPLPVSISGTAGANAAYSIGCNGIFITTASSITNGQKICVRVTTGFNSGDVSVATLVTGALVTRFYASTADPAPQNRYRIYIPSTGGHLFTTDKNEYDTLIISSGVYVNEGVDHKLFTRPVTKNGQPTTPFYRIYIKAARQHFWTSDQNEYNTLRAQKAEFSDDGIDGYIFLNAGVTNSVPLYRLVLNNTPIHHWTIDKNEFDILVRSGSWTAEGSIGNPSGVTGYVMPK